MKQFERRRAKDSASLVELPLLPSRRRCRVPEAAAATSSWHQREQGRHPRAVTVALSHWTSSWCRRIACVIIWLISSDCASLWMTSELANPPWPWYPKLVLHVAAASSSPPPSPPTTHDYFATIEDSASGSGRSSSTSGSSMMSSSAASVSHPPSITPVDVLAVGAAAPSRHERRLAPGDIVQPSLPVVPQRIERKTTLSLSQVLYRAGQRGLGGGIPGAIAGAIQVLALMWLRTVINYQCRYGTTFAQAMRTLLNDGGIARLYCGLGFALIQAPLSRFVSTAANDGVESLLANLSWTQSWGPSRTTVVASIFVGLWRMLLMPVDTAKTVLQIDSVEGFRSLMRRVRGGKVGLLYSGAIANAVSAILGHYPWFYTYNVLSSSDWMKTVFPSQLVRNAGIGVAASIVSDTVVNAFRVIKTTKQSLGSKQSASYAETVRIILAADGWKGLFGRGLRTRIYANALQSVLFTIIWRGLVDYFRQKTSDEAETS